jgi:flagellar biosynthesis/type III secretory pathway protein FliH
LFNGGPGSYCPSLPSAKKNNSEIDPEQKEKISREGYDKGFEAGRQHACRIALEAIEPNLADFLQAYENVSAFHQHVTDTAAHQIIEMALNICGQILSKPIDTTDKDITAVRNELRDAMVKAHHINLCFNSEDLSALRELMSCFNLPWPKSEAVDIDVSDVLEKGRLKVERNEKARKEMELLMTERLPNLLA